ncbi:MAG TPA: hypothetical protein VEU08_17195 [Vicinamibacterales bacterium]|nr:hypothetical protein [Vicinamibacterales bacterium]
MALLFEHDAHRYFLDGIETPSMTRILRDSGVVSFEGVPEFILERARKRGSAVHALCHYLNENDLDWASVDEAYRGYLDGWRRLRDERQIEPLLCEYRVASRRHRLTGTIDILCAIAGDGWLLDYATGDPVACGKQLQTAGYLGMAFEWSAEDAKLAAVLRRFPRWRRASVRLRADGTFQFREYLDPRDYSRVQTLAAAWHIRSEFGGVAKADDVAA